MRDAVASLPFQGLRVCLEQDHPFPYWCFYLFSFYLLGLKNLCPGHNVCAFSSGFQRKELRKDDLSRMGVSDYFSTDLRPRGMLACEGITRGSRLEFEQCACLVQREFQM